MVAAASSLGLARASSLSAHHPRSVSSMEIHTSRRFHPGVDHYFTTIPSYGALRTRLFFKGGRVSDLTSLKPHVGGII
jgi:hypothetical protein